MWNVPLSYCCGWNGRHHLFGRYCARCTTRRPYDCNWQSYSMRAHFQIRAQTHTLWLRTTHVFVRLVFLALCGARRSVHFTSAHVQSRWYCSYAAQTSRNTLQFMFNGPMLHNVHEFVLKSAFSTISANIMMAFSVWKTKHWKKNESRQRATAAACAAIRVTADTYGPHL